MPHWRTLIPSEWLKAEMFNGKDVTLTIASVEVKQLEKIDNPKQKETRGVVHFKETPKFMPLNVTNAASFAAMWGDDYTQWSNHRVTLFPGKDRVQGKEVPAIRVRGAPDLPRPVSFEIRCPRRAPIRMSLVNTSKAAPNSLPPDVVEQPVEVAPVDEGRQPGSDDDAA